MSCSTTGKLSSINRPLEQNRLASGSSKANLFAALLLLAWLMYVTSPRNFEHGSPSVLLTRLLTVTPFMMLLEAVTYATFVAGSQ
jgi:hypothetical protein